MYRQIVEEEPLAFAARGVPPWSDVEKTLGLANVGEGAIAVVAVQAVRQRREVTRRTNVAALAVEADAARVILERPIDVVADV